MEIFFSVNGAAAGAGGGSDGAFLKLLLFPARVPWRAPACTLFENVLLFVHRALKARALPQDSVIVWY